MKPPAYFERVRAEAAGLWGKLQADPRLRGPWVQLFQQVTNSPEHVLSELLQNADDSGATRASIDVDGDALVVSHNGRDFSESDFNALCSFGSSNKGSLHTIGFRGIGFKSAFSVGPRVELRTPTLSVVFQKDQFTLPVWESLPTAELGTSVRVPLSSQAMRTRLLAYLATWTTSPLSLLFFGSLRSLRVNGAVIGFREVGAGPVEGSAWYEAPDSPGRLLVLRSTPKELPKDALREVRETRGDMALVLPPLSVQVVLGPGADGRVHVVLPTSISTALPFACNAPFIQDPARIGIKDPLLSPTNRWLLNQIGALVGSAVLQWAGDSSQSAQDRVGAYALLPGKSGEHHDPQTAVVVSSLRENLKGVAFTLGAGGQLHHGSDVLIPIEGTRDIWPSSELCKLSGSFATVLSHPAIPDTSCHRIAEFGGGQVYGEDEVLLRVQQVPSVTRPAPEGLRQLWRICSSRLYSPWGAGRFNPAQSAIVPAYGSPILHRKDRVLRLGDIGAQVSHDDLEFLGGLVPTADLEFTIDSRTSRTVADFSTLLSALDLDRPVGAAQLLQKAGAVLRLRKDTAGILRLGRIAGFADVVLDPTFPLVIQSGGISSIKDGVLGPTADEVEPLFPDGWLDRRRISDDYLNGLTNEQIGRWTSWAAGERAGLPRFPLPAVRFVERTKAEAKEWAAKAQAQWPEKLPLKHGSFGVDESHFDPELREHWNHLEDSGVTVAAEVLRELIVYGWQRLEPLTVERVVQQGPSRTYQLAEGPAAWVRWLASRPCVPDERGVPRQPAALLLANADTEALRGVEHFVATEFSQSKVRPLLLQLGVRDSLSDASGLLDRLRSLSAESTTSIEVVAVLYRALDRLWSKADAAGRAPIRAAFEAEALVLSADGVWRKVGELARTNPLNLPAIATVHPDLAATAFLGHCGLLDQPRREQVADWLRARIAQGVLPEQEQAQAKSALGHLGAWGVESVGALLTLRGEVRPLSNLKYLLRHDEVAPVLFPHVQAEVGWGYADLDHTQALLAATQLVWLGEHAQRRVVNPSVPGRTAPPGWLRALASQLARYVSDPRFGEDAPSISRLAASTWSVAPRLLVELWDNDRHLGPPQEAKAVWEGELISAAGRRVDHEQPLAEVLAQPFTNENLRTIVRRSVGRDSEFIAELCETLGPPQVDVDADGERATSGDAQGAPIEIVEVVPPQAGSESEDAAAPTPARGGAGSLPAPAKHLPTDGVPGAVAILGGGAGLSGPRSPRASAKADASQATRRLSWVDPARQWLRSEGFVRALAGKREEHWSHPDGRSARLSRLPVHLMVSNEDGTVTRVVHVLLQRSGKARTLPVLHETWQTLITAGPNASLLIVHGDRHVLVPFGRVVRDGATYPSAYMVRLPDGLLDS